MTTLYVIKGQTSKNIWAAQIEFDGLKKGGGTAFKINRKGVVVYLAGIRGDGYVQHTENEILKLVIKEDILVISVPPSTLPQKEDKNEEVSIIYHLSLDTSPLLHKFCHMKELEVCLKAS